jgi:pimeloyl-ACP methyl ester carboxylesterase
MASTASVETITSADGTPIAFERTGSGPPLVLVHGTTADRTRWHHLLPALTEHFTVYTVDRRGRGESGDAADYDLTREFEDVAAVVEAIDEPVVLLGHSFGALCALEAALRTDNLDRLVLYEAPLPVSDDFPDDADALAEMASLRDDGKDEEALVLFLRDVAGLPPAELDALRAAPNWPARVTAVHTVLRELPAVEAYEFDAARFAGLTTPTVLLSGGESPRFYGDATDALTQALPNSRVVVLEGHAHAAMNTGPDRFVDEVVSFSQESS